MESSSAWETFVEGNPREDDGKICPGRGNGVFVRREGRYCEGKLFELVIAPEMEWMHRISTSLITEAVLGEQLVVRRAKSLKIVSQPPIWQTLDVLTLRRSASSIRRRSFSNLSSKSRCSAAVLLAELLTLLASVRNGATRFFGCAYIPRDTKVGCPIMTSNDFDSITKKRASSNRRKNVISSSEDDNRTPSSRYHLMKISPTLYTGSPVIVFARCCRGALLYFSPSLAAHRVDIMSNSHWESSNASAEILCSSLLPYSTRIMASHVLLRLIGVFWLFEGPLVNACQRYLTYALTCCLRV